VPCAGQHVFECGVMWSCIVFGQHPLPGYPDHYVTAPPRLNVQYTEASMTGIPADDGVALLQSSRCSIRTLLRLWADVWFVNVACVVYLHCILRELDACVEC
jgi:hypothetical protein